MIIFCRKSPPAAALLSPDAKLPNEPKPPICDAGRSVQLNDWLVATLSILAIALTTPGVALTILGVLIAIIAVWGYRAIKEEARSIADATAKKQIETYLTGAHSR
jgi:hypothetical protein